MAAEYTSTRAADTSTQSGIHKQGGHGVHGQDRAPPRPPTANRKREKDRERDRAATADDRQPPTVVVARRFSKTSALPPSTAECTCTSAGDIHTDRMHKQCGHSGHGQDRRPPTANRPQKTRKEKEKRERKTGNHKKNEQIPNQKMTFFCGGKNGPNRKIAGGRNPIFGASPLWSLPSGLCLSLHLFLSFGLDSTHMSQTWNQAKKEEEEEKEERNAQQPTEHTSKLPEVARNTRASSRQTQARSQNTQARRPRGARAGPRKSTADRRPPTADRPRPTANRPRPAATGTGAGTRQQTANRQPPILAPGFFCFSNCFYKFVFCLFFVFRSLSRPLFSHSRPFSRFPFLFEAWGGAGREAHGGPLRLAQRSGITLRGSRPHGRPSGSTLR